MKVSKIWGAALLALAGAAAQATVTTSVVGNTTTYAENFNGGSSFTAGYFNAPGADDYMWLNSPVGAPSSSYSFSSAVDIASLTISMWYSAYADPASGSLMGGSFSNGQNFNNTTGNSGPLAGTALVLANNPGADSNWLASSRADQFFSTTWSNLAAGTYSLNFAVAGGSLKIDDVRISVTAVPEPETYAMMLAGLGLIGAIARRRRAKQA
jgi:hypothetical protein